MNKGMLTVGIILLSILALIFVNVLSSFSTGSELDYYLLKETVDAAMVDSIDYAYYHDHGIHRIDKEKFVESFLYRFNDTVDRSRDYDIQFYDINEIPPKVSVKIDSLTAMSVKNKETGKYEAAKISTSYDAILETDYKSFPLLEKELMDIKN